MTPGLSFSAAKKVTRISGVEMFSVFKTTLKDAGVNLPARQKKKKRYRSKGNEQDHMALEEEGVIHLRKKRLDCNRKFPCTQRGTTAIPRNQTQRHSAFPLLFQLDKTVRRQLGKVLLREIITHGWLKPHRHNTSLCQSYNLTSTYTVSSWI